MKKDWTPVGECYVCGITLYRENSHEWVFFKEILACRKHEGVKEWYEGALKMTEEKWTIEQKKHTGPYVYGEIK